MTILGSQFLDDLPRTVDGAIVDKLTRKNTHSRASPNDPCLKFGQRFSSLYRGTTPTDMSRFLFF
jgi:hypothetical protein